MLLKKKRVSIKIFIQILEIEDHVKCALFIYGINVISNEALY